MANKIDGVRSEVKPKPYTKPIFIKGPVLTSVTAGGSNSPINIARFCWVARAAFGESDIRWMIFRSWLVEDAPAWFRRLYSRYGESIGAWLAGHDSARRVVRTLMMPAVHRKLR